MNKLTNEMIQKAKACKTVEELLSLAKENGYSLTEEQATAKFNEWNKIGELADEELDNVSGGGCSASDKFYVGRNIGLWDLGTIYCETCGSERYVIDSIVDSSTVVVRCANGCANVYDGKPLVTVNVGYITD